MMMLKIFNTRYLSLDEAEYESLRALLGAYEGRWLHLQTDRFRRDVHELFEKVMEMEDV